MPYPDECANPECKRYLHGFAFRSEVDPRYCHDCGDLFWSFQPRLNDHPFRIDPDLCFDGERLSAEQCDNCGWSEYTVKIQVPGNGRRAVCDNCGTQWSITDRPGRLLVW